ncbi:hypothetical protein P168DRAFT_242275, partial [Aspergillus campestris IBT 28561]
KHQTLSGFHTCPVEILGLIFKFLSPAELRVLCFVNKDFCTATEPFLYSKVRWIWKEGHPPPPITLLLRTIICKPQLAAYITNIHLDVDFPWRCAWSQGFPKVPVGSDMDEFIIFIRGTGVPYADLWIQALRNGRIDAFVALLLAQPLNLRYLYLGNVFTQESTLIGMVFRLSLFKPMDYKLPGFQHLQDVSLLFCECQNPAHDKKIRNTADVLPLFYLPNIQHLSVSIENPVTFTWPTGHLPDPLNLTSLHLTSVWEIYLGELLSVTRNLKALNYHWHYDEGITFRDQFATPVIDLGRLAGAISHVRGTLTDLTITASCARGRGGPFNPAVKTQGLLDVLINLDMVKRLEVPWVFLVGFAQDTTRRLQDVIPRNIEFLFISDNLKNQNEDDMFHSDERHNWPVWEWEDRAILGLIQTWLEHWKTCTPYLRGVTLLISYIDTDIGEWGPSVRDELRELGARYGVSLELIVDNTCSW